VSPVTDWALIKFLIEEAKKRAPSIQFGFKYYDQSNRLLPEPILWRVVFDLTDYKKDPDIFRLIDRINDLLSQHNRDPVSADKASSGGVTSPATGKPPSPKKRSPPERGK